MADMLKAFLEETLGPKAGETERILEENDVDLEVLRTMSEGDLEKLGISFGLRRKLTLAIRKSQKQLESTTDEVVIHDVPASSDSPVPKKLKSVMNLKEAMNNSSEGRELVKHLDGGSTLSTKQRKALVKMAVGHLVDLHGLWPPSKQKTLLAKEIVSTWPSTKDTTPGMEGHIDWIKFSPPHRGYMSTHTEYFQDTHKYRRHIIMDSGNPITITEVLTLFPRYQDIPQLIGIDFSMMHKAESEKFITQWSTLREKIILLGQEEYHSVKQVIERYQDTDRDLCALLVTKSKVNCSRSAAVQYLIQHVPAGTNIEEAINQIKKEYRQPLIVALGKETGDGRQKQYFLCLDSIPVSAGSTVVEAFDKLFKCFFIFGVNYPDILSHFYDYFASFVYEIWPTHKVKPMVRSFACAVKSS
ncbi:uncharacterized protein LOC105444971 [Strongylocentrotus purpuratus]|uniref:SAM domain-containing protein n=1 Tax=Strongylocentrotus purpuratus TaxID=7668 RepID=A0A7M7N4A5_STRPU|nr:uncharacterized protein LOC105444971 [Strongylocentrotus purpuratus]